MLSLKSKHFLIPQRSWSQRILLSNKTYSPAWTPPPPRSLRNQSTTTTAAAAAEQPVPNQTTTEQALVRHGPGDAVVTLNVGGKEFLTLRSTLQQNDVLFQHVTRAAANNEVITKSGAIFVDRDPTHFGLILQHLRNRSDNMSYSKAAVQGVLTKLYNKKKGVSTHVQLPKDSSQLRDLYVEATFYEIPELQAALCHQNWAITLASTISGGSANPFDQVKRAATVLRRAFLATGAGVGTTMLAVPQDFDSMLEWLGLSRKEKISSSETKNEMTIATE